MWLRVLLKENWQYTYAQCNVVAIYLSLQALQIWFQTWTRYIAPLGTAMPWIELPWGTSAVPRRKTAFPVRQMAKMGATWGPYYVLTAWPWTGGRMISGPIGLHRAGNFTPATTTTIHLKPSFTMTCSTSQQGRKWLKDTKQASVLRTPSVEATIVGMTLITDLVLFSSNPLHCVLCM